MKQKKPREFWIKYQENDGWYSIEASLFKAPTVDGTPEVIHVREVIPSEDMAMFEAGILKGEARESKKNFHETKKLREALKVAREALKYLADTDAWALGKPSASFAHQTLTRIQSILSEKEGGDENG